MKIMEQNKGFFFGNSPFGKQGMDIGDRIAQKKYLYHKEAMHLVTTTDKGEKKIDKGIEDLRGRIRSLMEENEEYNNVYREYRQQMAQAKEDYGIEDGSQEQKDLELLQKDFNIKNHGSEETLTEEEEERLKNMGELTDYQKLCMELYKQADDYKTRIEKNNLQMKGASATIRSISIERLKEHAMVDAEVAKEKLLEAASKEAMGMLVDDAKENLNEKAEELQENAEEREEKKEETEERIEASKENREEAEAVTEEIRENAKDLTDQMTDSEKIMHDVDEEIKKIMREQKLLEEDLKGLSLDVIR